MSAIYTEVADWKTEPRIFTAYLSYASANDKPRVKAGHCGGDVGFARSACLPNIYTA